MDGEGCSSNGRAKGEMEMFKSINIKKPYVIVLLNLVVIFGWNWYVKTRIASAKALIESIKLNARDFTEKEKLIVSINHINEIGFASNSIFMELDAVYDHHLS